MRTRLPVAGVVPDSPASNGWKPGFMTDLMAKDLDLALAYAAAAGVPLATTAAARQVLTAASGAGYGREDFSAVAKVVLACPARWRGRDPAPATACPSRPLILAADHRARGVVTIEHYRDYVGALVHALPACDGILATAQPLADLAAAGLDPAPPHLPLTQPDRAGRLGVRARRPPGGQRAARRRRRMDGGQAHDPDRPRRTHQTSPALELLGRVLEQARSAALEALIEPLMWRDGAGGAGHRLHRVRRGGGARHGCPRDQGARPRRSPPARNGSGPWPGWWPASACRSSFSAGPSGTPDGPRCSTRSATSCTAGSGMAIGRAVYQDPDPAEMAGLVAELVHQ